MKSGRVDVCANDPETRALGEGFGDDPCNDGTWTEHDVPTGGDAPGVFLISRHGARVFEALTDKVGSMGGGGGVK